MAVTTVLGLAGRLPAADPAGDDVVQTIINLVSEKDKDLRTVGLEQVRDEAKGEAATKRFAAVLPRLAPEAQVGLLNALADRGDRTARPAVLDKVKSQEESVRAAAVRALGPLGEPADVPLLVQSIAAANGLEKIAAASLVRLSSPVVNAAITDQMKGAAAKVRVDLLGVLVARQAVDCIPFVLATAKEEGDATVRIAAIEALGQLCRPDDIPALLPLVLKPGDTKAGKAAENSVVQVCGRVAEANERADVLLKAYAAAGNEEKRILLPLAGRVGGPAVLKTIDQAIANSNPTQHAIGMEALCNWPDSSVGDRLLKLAKSASDPADRASALSALIRVAPLPDKRPPAGKLKMLQEAMKLVATDAERKTILKRAAAIRSMDTLHYVVTFMDDPALGQQACATVVELAHHRELRLPHEAEFNKLLDQVIAVSKDPVVVERAKLYKAGRTYKRP